MQTIPLGSTGRTTTRLGFGCSSIMGVLDRRQSLALLESAFDAGIRHFDTAPMYGYGEAESCLGEFLNRHRGELTVTTKFGIPPAKSRALVRTARAILGPLVQRFPALKNRLRRPASSADPAGPQPPVAANPIFTAEQARTSLDSSLTALRVERIDLLLLHDVKPIDLADGSRSDALLRFLQDAVQDGKIGMFGVGTDREIVPELESEHPAYCAAMQYEWSVLNPPVSGSAGFRLNHRALSRHFRALAETLEADIDRCRRWSEEVGEDLADPEILPHLMLKASCVLNPASLVLFSSKRPHHIRTNVVIAGDNALETPARKLYGLIQRERLQTTAV